MQTIGIIPARYASSRFPGKPLVDILGKSMIHRVYIQANLSKLDKVLVATDDKRIFEHVQSFGGEVIMTDQDHQSGTDRCAEVAKQFENYELVVNIQGDEPFIDPEQIDQLIGLFKHSEDVQIGTLIKAIEKTNDLFDPNVVKVVVGNQKKALYFSRNPIPFYRNIEKANWLDQHTYFKHIGLYAYRRSILLAISQLATSSLEKAESLEQLRWLENNYQIYTAVTTKETIGIDTPTDLEKLTKS